MASTGRSWYPSVTLEFYKRSLDKAVIVDTKESRYLGVLASAPDTEDGKYIALTLTDVTILPTPAQAAAGTNIEPLPLVEQMLLKLDEITQIQRLRPEVLKKKGEGNVDQTS